MESSCSLPSLTSVGTRGTLPISPSFAGSDASFARISSSTVLARMLSERDELRAQMEDDRETSQTTMQLAREQKVRAWRDKMARSPYSVNHLAESQRIVEEARVKQLMRRRQQREEEKLREKIRKEIVSQTVAEVERVQEEAHMARMRVLAEEKRLRAARDVARTEARAMVALADPQRRVGEQSVEVRELREVNWQQRREERQRKHAQHMAKVDYARYADREARAQRRETVTR